MQNLVITQISDVEIRELFRSELQLFFQNYRNQNESLVDQIGGVELAVEITGLAKPTIYSLASERKIPHSKVGRKLYFSSHELMEWLRAGKRKTQSEIAAEAASGTGTSLTDHQKKFQR